MVVKEKGKKKKERENKFKKIKKGKKNKKGKKIAPAEKEREDIKLGEESSSLHQLVYPLPRGVNLAVSGQSSRTPV